jgi:hypothetical protein
MPEIGMTVMFPQILTKTVMPEIGMTVMFPQILTKTVMLKIGVTEIGTVKIGMAEIGHYKIIRRNKVNILIPVSGLLLFLFFSGNAVRLPLKKHGLTASGKLKKGISVLKSFSTIFGSASAKDGLKNIMFLRNGVSGKRVRLLLPVIRSFPALRFCSVSMPEL